MKKNFLLITASLSLLAASLAFTSNKSTSKATASEVEDLSNTYVLVRDMEQDWNGEYLIGYDDGTNIKLFQPGYPSEVNRSGNYIEIPSDGTGKIVKDENIPETCIFTIKETEAGLVRGRLMVFAPELPYYSGYVLCGMTASSGGATISLKKGESTSTDDVPNLRKGCIFNPGYDKAAAGNNQNMVAIRCGKTDSTYTSAESELRFNTSKKESESSLYNRFCFYGNSVTGYSGSRARLYKLGGVNPIPRPDHLDIDMTGVKTEYIAGDTLEKPSKITLYYSDNSTADVTSKVTYNNVDMTAPGAHTVYVSLTQDGVTLKTSYSINVGNPVLLSISLTGNYKTEYFVGQTFAAPQILIKFSSWQDAYTKGTQGYPTYNEPDMEKVGQQTITFTKVDPNDETNIKTCALTINIKVANLAKLQITEDPTLNYYQGDTVVFDGHVQGQYEDGKVYDMTDQVVTGEVDTSTAGTKIVTISVGDVSTTYRIEVTALQIVRYETVEQPTLEYYPHYPISFDGKIEAVYNSGKRVDVTNQATVTPTSLGESADVSVYIGEIKVDTYRVTIVPKVIVGYEISKPASKLTYFVGEEIVFDGKVNAILEKGFKEDITANITVGPGEYDKPGTVTVNLLHGGVQALTYEVTMVAVEPVSYEITQAASKSEYFIGDTVVFDGKVTATNNDGSTTDVTEQVRVSHGALDTEGPATISLKIGEEVVATYQINLTAVKVTKIEFTQEPTKTIDANGQYTFNGKVTATFNNGATRDVSGEVTVSAVDTSKAGEVTVTVSYEGKSLTYTLTVNALPEPEQTGGCGGNIATTSAILSILSVVGVCLLLIKRRKQA